MTPRSKAITRRQAMAATGKAGAALAIASPIVQLIVSPDGAAAARRRSRAQSGAARRDQLAALAGPDRVVMRQGKTYLSGWVGFGQPPRRGRTGRRPSRPALPRHPPRRRQPHGPKSPARAR